MEQLLLFKATIIGKLLLGPFALGKRKGSWVVDRVVGSAQLYQGDNSSLHDHLTQALTPREYIILHDDYI